MAIGSGNTRQTARLVALGSTIKNLKGLLNAKDGNDFWKITIGTRSSLNANLTKLSKAANADLQLLNSAGQVVAASKQPKNRAEKISNINLDPGTFFVRVLRRSGTTRYALSLQTTPVPVPVPVPVPAPVPVPVPIPSPIPDPNVPIPVPTPTPTTGLEDNTIDTSTAFPLSAPVNGYSVGSVTNTVGDTDTEDYFKFTPANSGQLKLQLAGLQADANVELFDTNRTAIASGDLSDIITKTISDGEVGSTFYVRVVQAAPGNNTNYTLNLSLLPTDTVGNDVLGSLDLAPTLSTPSQPRNVVTKNEFVGGGDDVDVYRFDLTSQAFIGLDLANLAGGNVDVSLHVANPPGVGGETLLLTSIRPGSAAEQLGGTLSPGRYFIRVVAADPNLASPYTLNLFAQSTTGLPTLTRDIIYGQPGSNVRDLTNVNGTLYFSADNDEGSGKTLWKSTGGGTGIGGTLDKTTKVGTTTFSTLSSFVNANGTLYFSGTDSNGQSGIWKSDGTTISLVSNVTNSANLTAVGNTLYFVAPVPTSADETDLRLWRSDGNTTSEVAGAGIFATDLVNVAGTLFYVATDPTVASDPSFKGRELWRVNNTTGLPELIDIDPDPVSPGLGSSNPTKLTAVGDNLYFVGTAGVLNREVQRLKITGQTYNRATDLQTLEFDQNTFNGALINTLDTNWNFGVVGNTVYFAAPSSAGAPEELYKVVGNTVTRVATGGASIVEKPRELTGFNGKLLFKGTAPGTNKEELWVTDGTEAGTRQLTTGSTAIGDLIVSGTKFFFAADAPSNGNLTGQELWTSDGTLNGTQLVYDIFPGVTTFTDPNDPNATPTIVANSAGVANFTDVNGQLFFTANNGLNGEELWSVF